MHCYFDGVAQRQHEEGQQRNQIGMGPCFWHSSHDFA